MTEPGGARSGKSPLATLLGSPDRQLNFGIVARAARRARDRLEADFGAPFLVRFLPPELHDELSSPLPPLALDRSAKISGEARLTGTGSGPLYSAFALEPDSATEAGVWLLQALIFAALLVNRKFSDRIGSTAPVQAAQFLTGAFGNQAERHQRHGEFLRRLPGMIDLQRISELLGKASHELPASFTGSLAKILSGLRQSIPRPEARLLAGSAPQLGPVASPPSGPRPTKGLRPPPRPNGPLKPVVKKVGDELSLELLVGPASPISPEAREHAVAEAESEAEQASESQGAILESSREPRFHERNALGKRVFLDLRHGAWARVQWDALSPAEMMIALKRWSVLAEEMAGSEERIQAEAPLIVLLVGCLGWTDEQVWSTPFIRSGDPIPDGFQRAIYWDTGEVTFTVPREGARYDPERRGHLSLVRPVSDRVTLQLPVEVSRPLARWSQHDDVRFLDSRLDQLRTEIRNRQRVERGVEPRETLSRLRNGHLLQLLTVDGDLPMAQLASGELLDGSDVGLSYLACPSEHLQRHYDAACSGHGLTPAAARETERGWVGGSKLQVEQEYITGMAARLRKGLGQPNGNRGLSVKEALRVHARLVPALAWQLCAGTLARPTEALGKITRTNLSILGRCAVLADKVMDEGHLGRLVPLPDLLCSSMAAYARHLRSLAAQKGMPELVVEAANKSLDGTGPLFFLSKGRRTRPMVLQDLRDALQKEAVLPVNVLRHRYASLLRIHGCPAPYVEAMMGHIQFGTQPFGVESFMDPGKYLGTTGAVMDRLLREDGWRPLYGLADQADDSWRVPPMDAGVTALRRDHAKRIEAMRARNVQEREMLRQTRAGAIRERARQVIVASDGAFFERRGGTLDKKAVLAMRRALTDGAASLAEAQASVEQLRDVLDNARSERGWRIASVPHFLVSSVDPTPFSTEYPGAYDRLLAIRGHWMAELQREGRASSCHLSHAVMALVLWHGVSDWGRLESVLRGLEKAEPCSDLPDAILVPRPTVDGEDEAEVLRGAVALAVVPLVGKKVPPADLTTSGIGRRIAGWLPKTLRTGRGGAGLLEALLESAAIAHHFESVGPVRSVYCGEQSSTGLPLRRVRRLLSKAEVPLVAIEPTQKSPSQPSAVPPALEAAPVIRAYRVLRDVLRVRSGKEKKLPHQGRTLERPFSDAALRDAILEELALHRKAFPLDGTISTLLCEYAMHLLTKGTSSSERIEAQTVYGYVVGVGGALTRVSPLAQPAHWEGDDVLDAYLDAIDVVPRRYRPFVARYLSYFHHYLVTHHGADPVDLRGMGGATASQPDVQLVTPREYAAARRYLAAASQSSAIGSVHSYRQSEDVLCLGYATGARSSELVLREKRELVIEPGRSVLLIRKNRYGRVKSRRGNRTIPLEGWVSAERLASLGAVPWRGDGSAVSANHPLLADPDRPMIPSDPAEIQAAVGAALRAATAEPDARLYALRHTAASMEFLYLFADVSLLRAIRAGCPEELPFPAGKTSIEFAELMGGCAALSQIHAASYRSRRGHASLRTSLGSYIHILPMLLPRGAVSANQSLSARAVAQLLGKSYAWVRQTMMRAGQSAGEGAPFAMVLLAKSWKCEAPEPTEGPTAPRHTLVTLRLANLARCIRAYYTTGDAFAAASQLQATDLAVQAAQAHLSSLRIQPDKGVGTTTSRPALFPIHSPERATIRRMGARSVDTQLLALGLEKMRSAPLDQGPVAQFWSWVYANMDPEAGFIRIPDRPTLEQVMTWRLAAMPESDTGQLVLVHDQSMNQAEVQTALGDTPWLAGAIWRSGKVSLGGQGALAATFVTLRGQVRLRTLLVLAVTWRLWSALKRA
jgi:integrase